MAYYHSREYHVFRGDIQPRRGSKEKVVQAYFATFSHDDLLLQRISPPVKNQDQPKVTEKALDELAGQIYCHSLAWIAPGNRPTISYDLHSPQKLWIDRKEVAADYLSEQERRYLERVLGEKQQKGEKGRDVPVPVRYAWALGPFIKEPVCRSLGLGFPPPKSPPGFAKFVREAVEWANKQREKR